MGKSIDLLLAKLDDSDFVADLFLVLHLDEIEQPTTSNTDGLLLRVPQCIDDLLSRESDGSAEVLKALITWARPETRTFSDPALETIADSIRSRYAALKQYGYLQSITDESDPEIAAALARALPAAKQQTGVVQRMKETVRKSITTVLSFSKRTGMAILMRGRELTEFVRDWFISLELPAKADRVIKKKAAFTSRVFAFKGGQATKFFVGIALGVAGLFVGAPAIVNISGLALAVVDP